MRVNTQAVAEDKIEAEKKKVRYRLRRNRSLRIISDVYYEQDKKWSCCKSSSFNSSTEDIISYFCTCGRSLNSSSLTELWTRIMLALLVGERRMFSKNLPLTSLPPTLAGLLLVFLSTKKSLKSEI